jgi:hypothetical protein
MSDKFTIDFMHNGTPHMIIIPAHDWNDAKCRLASIKATGVVTGKVVSTIEAPSFFAAPIVAIHAAYCWVKNFGRKS